MKAAHGNRKTTRAGGAPASGPASLVRLIDDPPCWQPADSGNGDPEATRISMVAEPAGFW